MRLVNTGTLDLALPVLPVPILQQDPHLVPPARPVPILQQDPHLALPVLPVRILQRGVLNAPLVQPVPSLQQDPRLAPVTLVNTGILDLAKPVLQAPQGQFPHHQATRRPHCVVSQTLVAYSVR